MYNVIDQILQMFWSAGMEITIFTITFLFFKNLFFYLAKQAYIITINLRIIFIQIDKLISKI